MIVLTIECYIKNGKCKQRPDDKIGIFKIKTIKYNSDVSNYFATD